MPAPPTVRLPTASGSIALEQARDAGDCISCPRTGGGMTKVTVEHSDKLYRVCGECLSTALASHFRRANSQRA